MKILTRQVVGVPNDVATIRTPHPAPCTPHPAPHTPRPSRRPVQQRPGGRVAATVPVQSDTAIVRVHILLSGKEVKQVDVELDKQVRDLKSELQMSNFSFWYGQKYAPCGRMEKCVFLWGLHILNRSKILVRGLEHHWITHIIVPQRGCPFPIFSNLVRSSSWKDLAPGFLIE